MSLRYALGARQPRQPTEYGNENVARRLGNTRSVCRNCYVHPAVVDSYLDGSMLDVLQTRAAQEMRSSLHRLRPEEAAVLATAAAPEGGGAGPPPGRLASVH